MIVITGATGFIGLALAQRLAAAEHPLRLLVRDPSKLPVALQRTAAVVDITQPQTLAGAFVSAETVIHCAGKLGAAGVPEAVYRAINVDGTRHVLDAVAAQAPAATVLHLSTPGLLGPRANVSDPIPDETAPYNPTNLYEKTKMQAELVALQLADQLDIRICRPEFVYGPGDKHVLGLFKAVQTGRFFFIGNGQNQCHPSYIDDVLDGMLAIVERGRRGEIYHIAGAQPVTWQVWIGAIASALGQAPPTLKLPKEAVLPLVKVAEMGLGVFGRKPPLSTTGVQFFSENRGTSIAKAARELGYAPQFDSARGAKSTVAWYRQMGWM